MSLVAFTQRPVDTIELSSTVTEAARRMCQNGVGVLVIIDAQDSAPIGIFTDRDVVVMLGESIDPREETVARFLHAPLHTASITESFDDMCLPRCVRTGCGVCRLSTPTASCMAWCPLMMCRSSWAMKWRTWPRPLPMRSTRRACCDGGRIAGRQHSLSHAAPLQTCV